MLFPGQQCPRMRPSPQTRCPGCNVQEAEVVLSVLGGLPEPYAMAVEILQLSDELTFQKTLSKLLQVEQRVQQTVQQEVFKDVTAVQAYGASTGNVSKCFYCNQPGHIKVQCHMRKADMQKKVTRVVCTCILKLIVSLEPVFYARYKDSSFTQV